MAENVAATAANAAGSVDRHPLLSSRRRRLAGRGLSFLVGRGLMRSPSTAAVREAARIHLEERRSDWGHSGPVVALDVAWNIAFVLIAAAVLVFTASERPPTPIRVWVCVYTLQCLLHAVLVWVEYRRRDRMEVRMVRGRRYGWEMEDEGEEMDVEESSEDRPRNRMMKKLESANALLSFFWWILGFYWIVIGGQSLLTDAPHLYWLTVVFLAFDVFFATICILLACMIGIALCCWLPCIITILQVVAGQESGASDADLGSLPRFTYRQVNQSRACDLNEVCIDSASVVGLNSDENNYLSPSQEDSECCICLCRYEDGVELHTLPCNHHFHARCIVKWLRINATCPLCKYSITNGDEHV